MYSLLQGLTNAEKQMQNVIERNCLTLFYIVGYYTMNCNRTLQQTHPNYMINAQYLKKALNIYPYLIFLFRLQQDDERSAERIRQRRTAQQLPSRRRKYIQYIS